MRLKHLLLLVAALNLLAFALPALAEDTVITMSTTTSTESSGLLDVLLPEFTKDTGIQVKVVAKGTGAALRDGMDGNADVLFVHDKAREEKFVEEGYGVKRYAVMHNDFILLGPKADPAGVKGTAGAAEAMKKIAAAGAMFISRGDDSGTHATEQALWKASGLKLSDSSIEISKDGKASTIKFIRPEGDWYYSIGQGMGKTITFAVEKQAYTLSDRGTWIKYESEGADLALLVEGDPLLFNAYGVIPVNPKKHPHVKIEAAQKFADWLVSARGQGVIAGYQLQGKQLFFPDAVK